MAVYLSRGEEQTLRFAERYARGLKAGDIVILDGEMGAGKTVFAKGVAAGLGITDDITSPTYAYMNDYGGKLYHYNCYRLSPGAQAEAMGLCDYFYADGVCLIEWAQNIADVLPANCKKVKITKISQNARSIEYD